MPSIQKFLAIETSTSPGSVAAGTLPSRCDIENRPWQVDNLAMQEFHLAETGSQGRHLMPVLTAAVESAGWSLARNFVGNNATMGDIFSTRPRSVYHHPSMQAFLCHLRPSAPEFVRVLRSNIPRQSDVDANLRR